MSQMRPKRVGRKHQDKKEIFVILQKFAFQLETIDIASKVHR